MRLTTKRILFALAAFAWASMTYENTANAQPLVTGGLTLYYDFDAIVGNQFLDESGNNFNGTINVGGPGDITPGTLTLETANARRGAGAANFSQSTNPSDLPVYVDVDGAGITTNFPGELPRTAITIAAWVNVTVNNTAQSVFQARTSSGGHGVPHFQLNSSGRLRMTFRDQTGNDVVQSIVYTDGDAVSGPSYPANEWFHYAGTYDMATNMWSQYYNGVEIASGSGTGALLGDWGGDPNDFFSAGIGAVYDSGGRRLDGLMDELYVFQRALSAGEIATLVSINGDFDNDGDIDGADFLKWQRGESPNALNASDLALWEDSFGTAGGALAAKVGAVPEPSSTALLSLALAGLVTSRRRRKVG